MRLVCQREANLETREALCTKIVTSNRCVRGVETNLGVRYIGKTVIVTTGTFLAGLIHIGSSRVPGGRSGQLASVDLSDSLVNCGLKLGRLKTGTPPRLLRRTIDFAKTDIQNGDEPIPFFTHWKEDLFHVEQTDRCQATSSSKSAVYPIGSVLERIKQQLPCYITQTTAKTAEIIRSNLHLSPLYSGTIKGTGPRYCPSIEDKIVKFHDKAHHHIFLEPEGIESEEIYVNGLSTSLPFQVQLELVKTVIGCESATIVRPAYAVEYDFSFPTQIQASLETKVCENLYLAGQINGTSGYEEAAAQGLMAGINASRKVRGLAPIILRRDQAYIGVLIDDLVTKGTSEPYRMFTSRAEFRLLLRQDNADMRLAETGHDIGLLPSHCYKRFRNKKQAIESEINRLEKTHWGTQTLAQLLRRPEVSYCDLPEQSNNKDILPEVIEQVEIAIKHSGYIARQGIEVSKFTTLENKRIPSSFDYSSVVGLRTEARQKLMATRPATLGQASRISGVSPADISLVMVWLKRASQPRGITESLPIPGTSGDQTES
jgi:tRNA uridine 5-carboxymethylaminomethyl modification enzyme